MDSGTCNQLQKLQGSSHMIIMIDMLKDVCRCDINSLSICVWSCFVYNLLSLTFFTPVSYEIFWGWSIHLAGQWRTNESNCASERRPDQNQLRQLAMASQSWRLKDVWNETDFDFDVDPKWKRDNHIDHIEKFNDK